MILHARAALCRLLALCLELLVPFAQAFLRRAAHKDTVRITTQGMPIENVITFLCVRSLQ